MIHPPFRNAARQLVAAAILGASITACASSTGAAGSTGATTPEQAAAKSSTSSSRYVLVQADLDKAKAENVYDAISKLRPEFFRGHNESASFIQQQIKGGAKDPGPAPGSVSSSTGGATLTAPAEVMVYRDNVKLSGLDDLRQIQLATVREIRYLPGPDAVIRFGSNHSAGAILVMSK